MKTKTYNVYSFSELSGSAKCRAKQQHAELFGYSWGDEAIDSIKALAEHFGGKMRDWSVDFAACSYSSARFDMPEMDAEEIEEKLAKLGTFNAETLKGNGDCVLTGYCADEDAIDGFRAARAEGERDLTALMQAAFRTWLEAAQSDYAGQYEDATFAETAEANGWEYDENGNIE